MEQMPTTEYPLLLKRLQSSFIDSMLILFLIILFSQFMNQFANFPTALRIVFVCIILLYEPICVAFACTLGNYIIGIRVRKNDNINERINLLQPILRYVAKIFLGMISFFTIHSNTKKRAIHDMVANSVMLKV